VGDGAWRVKIEADSTWLCEHSERGGNPAPPTRLTVKDGMVENPQDSADRRRVYLRCPECGTHWRVWEHERTAKLYVANPSMHLCSAKTSLPPAHYHRSKTMEIDQILADVRELVPDVEITQYKQSWPGDDDGLWFFRLPSSDNEVQIESWNGTCPFIVESGKTDEADTGTTVPDVVAKVVSLLRL
jgi:hypothetical protein